MSSEIQDPNPEAGILKRVLFPGKTVYLQPDEQTQGYELVSGVGSFIMMTRVGEGRMHHGAPKPFSGMIGVGDRNTVILTNRGSDMLVYKKVPLASQVGK